MPKQNKLSSPESDNLGMRHLLKYVSSLGKGLLDGAAQQQQRINCLKVDIFQGP